MLLGTKRFNVFIKHVYVAMEFDVIWGELAVPPV
jgi:hypothetical protein